MVKKYKKYFKKYYKKKTLKKGNIFKYKNAKSQAKQIYALNKKVNNVYKKIKPETQIVHSFLQNRIFTTDGNFDSEGVMEWHTGIYLYEQRLLSQEAGYGNYSIKGKLLRPYNFTINGAFGNRQYQYIDETDNTVERIPMTGYLRILVCKLARSNMARFPGQICKSFGSFGSDKPDIGLITGPLIDNIAGGLEIVKDKVIKVNEKNPYKCFKIKVKNPGTYKIDAINPTSTVPGFLNEYVIYIQYYCPIAYTVDNHIVGPKHELVSNVKFAFVDSE